MDKRQRAIEVLQGMNENNWSAGTFQYRDFFKKIRRCAVGQLIKATNHPDAKEMLKDTWLEPDIVDAIEDKYGLNRLEIIEIMNLNDKSKNAEEDVQRCTEFIAERP